MSALELIERDEQPTNVATLPVGSSSPVEMFRIAVQSGADMDQLERFMTLQTQWERREAEKAYSKAFAAFKSEAVRIIKNRSVTAGPLNGKKYAELFAVVNAVTPALSQHGLSASWKLTKDERDWLEVTCTLRHELGHSESVSMGGPPDAGGAKNKIQERASTITYLERYTLKAITGLSEQEDDDGGVGKQDDRMDWCIKADTAETESELRSIMREGVKVFQAKRDTEGYALFAKAVQTRGAALKASHA